MNTHKNMDFFEYWAETRKYPLLREEEIHQILQRTDKTEAFNEIILNNLQLVCQCVFSWRYAAEKCGLCLLDLASEAGIGLLLAVRAYNPALGRFKFFVRRYIQSYIQKAIFSQTGFSRLEAKKRLRADKPIHVTVSLSKELVCDSESDEPLTIQDILKHPEDKSLVPLLEVNDLMKRLKENTGKIHPLAFSVLEKRYGVYTRHADEPLSLEKIGRELNMSKEGVRKIENRALAYLSSISK